MKDEITITDISSTQVLRKPRKHSRKIGTAYIGGVTAGSGVTTRLPEAYEVRADYMDKLEKDLWDIYERLGYHTDFGAVFRDALVSQLLPPFHFESESGKHEIVEDFWKQHDMDNQLRQIVDNPKIIGIRMTSAPYL